ncbi:RHS repeat-associated core domain-containing protein [Pseudidiomarina sp. PP-1MA]|uniref:RHS repeat-associated core domain-containing protein n=1 Tax=Pseudidiomarina sp. PP-1MA TaxID=3237706 RepID=A0AB39X788_9GAMM
MARTNSAGRVESRRHYQPFGDTYEAPSDDIGYTGHKYDNDSGLSYMQARYYDPVIGRFYSNDPVDFLGHVQHGNPTMGFNRYAYAYNNPYKYKDPTGKIPLLIPVIMFVAKEIAAEAASQATGGATDFLSTRRMATKGAKKLYLTYTKTNKRTGEVYSGRTSGTGDPMEILKKRDGNHHKNKDGFGPAEPDKVSENKDAIRGREQRKKSLTNYGQKI